MESRNYITKDKANLISLLLLAFVIPLKRELAAPLIILFFLTSIWNKKEILKPNRSLLFSCSLFTLYLIASLYSPNMEKGMQHLSEKLSLLILPLCFFFRENNFQKESPLIFKSYIQGCVVSIGLSLINAAITYSLNKDISTFFYSDLSVFLHSSYFALYLCFAIVILYAKIHVKYLWTIYIKLFLIVLFSIIVLLLASKTGWIVLCITHLLSIIVFTSKKIKLKLLTILLVCSIGGVIVINYTPPLKNRILEVFDSISDSERNNSTSSVRIKAWKSAINIIKDSPIIGLGHGNVKQQQITTYKKRGYFEMATKQLNAHNQYLQTTLVSGIIGGIVLIIFITYPLIISYKIKAFIFTLFCIQILINFTTEAMLETQAGVVFIAFFYSLFFTRYFSEKSIKKAS